MIFLSILIPEEYKGSPQKKPSKQKFYHHRTFANYMIFHLFRLISFVCLVTVAQKLASSPIRMTPNQQATVQTSYKIVILSWDCTKAFWDPDAYSWWVQHAHKDAITYEDTTTSKVGWSWFRRYFDPMRDCSQTFWFSWNGSQAGWTCVIICLGKS